MAHAKPSRQGNPNMGRITTAVCVVTALTTAGCARTVTYQELRRLEWEGAAETVNAWLYEGTSDGYHYLHNIRTLFTREVRIRQDQLQLKRVFPYTLDDRKWIRLPMGVWFINDPKMEADFILPGGKNP
jgi:hypothetical protein